MEGGPISPTPTAGGEAFPKTPAFPISPQTPYFNLCKFPLWLTDGSVELRPGSLNHNICSQQLVRNQIPASLEPNTDEILTFQFLSVILT